MIKLTVQREQRLNKMRMIKSKHEIKIKKHCSILLHDEKCQSIIYLSY